MPERVLPLRSGSVVRRHYPPRYPSGWWHEQVAMPPRAGVDAVAGAVQLVPPGECPNPDVALAAAVRHWCGEDQGQLVVHRNSARTLERDGQHVLRLDDLELHDPALHQALGCPLVRVDDDTSLLWACGTRHRRDSEPVRGWVPYGQTVVRWLEREPGQPVAHTMNMAGLGVGRTHDEAIDIACADLIAQDAVMTWWVRGTETRLAEVSAPLSLVDAWGTSTFELTLHQLPTTTGVAVSLAVVSDQARGLRTLSAAAGHDTASRSAAQALWQLACADDLCDPEGDLHRAGIPGLVPHSTDRAYLAQSGPGSRVVVDPIGNVQLGLDPRLTSRLDRRAHSSRSASSGLRDQAAPLDTLVRDGHDVWIVDLTTPDVVDDGWHCVRALTTGMARIPVAAFPLDPSGRVASAAQQLGYPSGEPEPLPYPGW